MKLLLYGMSHYTVPEADAKKYQIKKENLKDKLNEINDFPGIDEVVILTNESRTEFYFHVDETSFNNGDILRFIAAYSEQDLEQVILETYSKFNEEVVRHLLFVLSGKESVFDKELTVLTEADEALMIAADQGTAGSVLTTLFEKAIIFSIHMRTLPEMKNFYQSNFSNIVRKIASESQNLEHRRLYLIGISTFTIFLAKALYYLSVSSIIIDAGEDTTSELIDHLKEWTEKQNMPRPNKVFKEAGRAESVYQLASSDVVVSEEMLENHFITEEVLENMFSIRMTKKKQLWISLFEKGQTTSRELAKKGIQKVCASDLIQNVPVDGASEEENERVKTSYEEAVNQEIDLLINNYYLQTNQPLPRSNEKLYTAAPTTEVN